MNIIIGNTIRISEGTDFIAQNIANELTVENPKFREAINSGRSTWGLNPVIKNFTVDNSGVTHLPRGYIDRLKDLLIDNDINYNIVNTSSVVPITPLHVHSIELRDYQYLALQKLGQHSEGVLVAPAGSGKTIMGLSITIMSGQKLLWITHTKVLAQQFIDRAHQFITNLEEDDVGYIGAGDWKIGNKITVGLVQTLVRSPEKLREISDDFGIVVVDETHHCPSATFTKVVNNLNPYYMYGLTATPNRRDGLESILFQNVGPIRHIVPRKEVAKGNKIITPVVKAIKLQTPLSGSEDYQELLKTLVENDERNNIIVSDIVYESNQKNVCIVVTDRKIHAEILLEKLQEKDIKVGIATGSYNDKFRKTTLSDLEKGVINTLVCTTHLMGEGFDHAPLNRLFLCLPFRDENKCEQVIGRVQRSCIDKTDAIVYDYVDQTHGLTKHQYKNSGLKGCRYNVYRKLKCNIT